MKILILSVVALLSSAAFANDGGIAAIKVSQIKMRENRGWDGNGNRVLVRKIAKPDFEITLEGGEASKLQKVLPSMYSVITVMHPELEQAFNESFKSLGIYSDKANGVTGKVLEISCTDAVLNDEGDKITKTGKSVCKIIITPGEDMSPPDGFGDANTWEPPVCKK